MSKETKSILRFMLKTAVITMAGLLPFAIWYVAADPFLVLRDYDASAFYPDPSTDKLSIGYNRGVVTFTNLEREESRGQRYNAFIFGSSISCNYDAWKWISMADTTGNAKPYHLDSSAETLMTMAAKFEYLVRTGHDIDYALLVLDPKVMGSETNYSPPYVNPVQLHDNLIESVIFHYAFFRASTSAKFLKKWIPSHFYGRPVEYDHSPMFNLFTISYDSIVNQESIPEIDEMIANTPDSFYERFKLIDSPAKSSVEQRHLTGERLEAVYRIAAVLAAKHTDYQVIISPNRFKKTLNPSDLKVLNDVFGQERVHDFSHTMCDALENDTLLYDNIHYRPVFAERLMRLVYCR